MAARSAEFVAVVASGSYWAKPAQVAARINRLRIRDDAALIMLTEVTRDQYEAVKGTRGWRQAKVGEIAWTWRTDTLRARGRLLTLLLTAVVFFTGKGGRKDGVTAAGIRLVHIPTGRKGVARGFHAPASIQDGLDWSDKGPRVKAAQETFRNVGARVRRVKRKHPDWFQLVTADTNLDMFRPRWVAYLEATLDLDCWWAGRLPERGTHGDRLIDGGFVHNLKVLDADLAGSDPAHDHTTGYARLRITSPKETP